MIEIKIESDTLNIHEISKQYMIAFLSLNTVQKREVSKATIGTEIADNALFVRLSGLPIVRRMATMICSRVVDRNKDLEATCTEEGEMLFAGKTMIDVPQTENRGKITNAKVFNKALSEEEIKELVQSPDDSNEEVVEEAVDEEQVFDFDPGEYTRLSVKVLKKSHLNELTNNELKAVLNAEKSGKNRKTVISYLNKLITG